MKLISSLIDNGFADQNTKIDNRLSLIAQSADIDRLEHTILSSINDTKAKFDSEISNVLLSLATLRSYDDALKALVTQMNDSLLETYNSVLEKLKMWH